MDGDITLFRSIIIFCGTDSISESIPRYSHIQTGCGKYFRIFHGVLSVPHNIVMDLNNFMDPSVLEKLLLIGSKNFIQECKATQ